MPWIVDLDGVVMRGQQLLPGAVRFLQRIRQRGDRLVVLTNNSTMPADAYVSRLREAGVALDRREVVTSSLAAARYLRSRAVRGPVLAVGEEGLLSALSEAGIEFYTIGGDDSAGQAEQAGPAPAAVVVGLDRRVTYAKLRAACRAIRSGAIFVGTNPDVTLPAEGGEVIPGCGALLAALAACSGVQPVVVGKPNPQIMEMALERLEVSGDGERRTVWMVGDRLDTDVAAAARMGLHSALVLTGVTRREDLAGSPVRPDRVFENLDELTDALLGG